MATTVRVTACGVRLAVLTLKLASSLAGYRGSQKAADKTDDAVDIPIQGATVETPEQPQEEHQDEGDAGSSYQQEGGAERQDPDVVEGGSTSIGADAPEEEDDGEEADEDEA